MAFAWRNWPFIIVSLGLVCVLVVPPVRSRLQHEPLPVHRLPILAIPAVSTTDELTEESSAGFQAVAARFRVTMKLTAKSTTASAAEATEIKGLIRNLADIDSPDFGLSGTMSGRAFLPIDGMSQAGALVLTNHRLKSSPDLRRLVELGPKSLPFLLDSLDDQTPTKLVMNHGGVMGVMWYADDEHKHISSYEVKVGDVCFVAIGQIVGEGYQAVRYQPTACIIINSPTHNAKLCQMVRSLWSGDNAARKLFDSLLQDFCAEPIFNGKSLDGWYTGSHLQIQAAMRLLFYFPDESAELIAARLDGLDVASTGPTSGSPHTPEELDAFMKQCVKNRVRADEFVNAVAFSAEPKIKAGLLRVFDRATNPDVIVAAAKSVGPDDPSRIRERIAKLLDDVPDDDIHYFSSAGHLLEVLGKYGGPEARSTFRKYLERRTVERCHSMCFVLQRVRTEWACMATIRIPDSDN